jgi:hypothetical protein
MTRRSRPKTLRFRHRCHPVRGALPEILPVHLQPRHNSLFRVPGAIRPVHGDGTRIS